MSDKNTDKQVYKQIHKLFWSAMTCPGNRLNFFITISMTMPYFAIMNVLIPLQTAYALEGVLAKNTDVVIHHVWIIVGLAVLWNAMLAIATHAFNANGTKGAMYIQRKVFRNYLQKDYEFYGDTHVGALSSQTDSVREAYISYNRVMLYDSAKIIAIVVPGLVVIGLHSLLLAAIGLLSVIIIVVTSIVVARIRLPYRKQLGEAHSKLNAVVSDTLSHGMTVKTFARESVEEKRLEESMGIWARAQQKSWDLFIPSAWTRNILGIIALIALLLASVHLYKDGTISVAIVILIQLYMLKLITATLEIAELIKLYDSVIASSYKAVQTMMVTQSVVDKQSVAKFPPKLESLRFDAVSYKYKENSKQYALKNVSFTLPRGKRLGVVGYSGGGKTTLTKLVLRFIDVSNGSIQINGIDIRDFSQQELREYISYVPQEPILFHRSIYENIAYGLPEATKAEVLQAAKRAYVDEFVADLPNRYDTIVGERGVKLSGGQRQRVAIARAILKDAPILILDEATSALDSQSEQYIQKALWSLMKQKTAIVIAHRLSTVQKMDEIIVLNNGEIIQQGTHDKLKAQKGIYKNLWDHQSGGYIGAEASNG